MTKRNAKPPNVPDKGHLIVVIVSLIVTGLGIGWLAGLSVSPAISAVITSVIGVAAAVVTALSGLKPESSNPEPVKTLPLRVQVWPLAVLVFFVVIGSGLGVLVRNNHLFGSDVDSEIAKWKRAGVPKEAVMERLFGTTATYSPYTEPVTDTLQLEIDRWVSLGITETRVVNRLFEQRFANNLAIQSQKTLTSEVDSRLGSYLFAANTKECSRLLAAATMATAMDNDQLLLTALRNSTVTQLRTLPDLVADRALLTSIVEQVLCAD